MKKVLFIAYHYPPLGGVGSQRSQKFARYLLDNDWRSVVLTPEKGSYLFDPSLEDGSNLGIEVVRTKNVDLSSVFKVAVPVRHKSGLRPASDDSLHKGDSLRRFVRRAVHTGVYVPDAQIGWFPYAMSAGKRILKTQDIDAIYSTSFPITAHLVAYRLKQATGKPWIADFRDLWTEFHYAEYPNALRTRLDRFIESRLLEKTDAILTVSDALAETLRRLTGGRKRVEVIRNGFDSSEFAEIEYKRPPRWTITYVGLFYGARQDPSVFLTALQRLIESDRIPRQEVLFNIVGEPDAYVQELVGRFGLADVTCFTGFVAHREALSHQVRSSLLLLILHGDKANPGVITGKIFEYLGSRRPILGIVPQDFEVARIIVEAAAGVTVDPSDASGVERELLSSYRDYRSGVSDHARSSDLSAYERRVGARQLAGLLNEATNLNAHPDTVLAEVV
ncbi:MAG TPA: glycosyltransferase family 4 protein [Blastocatellia bacterium]|nr:glycosyltransferase family 4 protein [Blastocatellia bacterium]